MSEPTSASKPAFDPSKINNAFSVIGAVVVVLQIILVVALTQAEEDAVQITIVICMVVVMLGALAAVAYIVKATGRLTPAAPGVDQAGVHLEPARADATSDEIAHPAAQLIAGPEGTFLIEKAPPGWTTEQLTEMEWRRSHLLLSPTQEQGAEGGDAAASSAYAIERILRMTTERRWILTPRPGQTTIDGARIPTAIPVPVEPEIAVLTVGRFRAPFFTDRTLLDAAVLLAGDSAKLVRLTGMRTDTLPTSERQLVTFTYQQELVNVDFDDVSHDEVQLNLVLIGIEGFVKHHFIVTRFLSGANLPDEYNHRCDELQRIVSSFKPLEVADAKARMVDDQAKAAEHLGTLFEQRANAFFAAEASVLAARAGEFDFDSVEGRAKAVVLLRPLVDLAGVLDVDDPGAIELIEAIKAADAGDSTTLVDLFEAGDGPDEGEDRPDGDPDLDESGDGGLVQPAATDDAEAEPASD